MEWEDTNIVELHGWITLRETYKVYTNHMSGAINDLIAFFVTVGKMAEAVMVYFTCTMMRIRKNLIVLLYIG